MESVDNPLHEAAKRGNVGFLQECLHNKVRHRVKYHVALIAPKSQVEFKVMPCNLINDNLVDQFNN